MGFPPAAAADDRFAPPTTPESVYSPTPVGGLCEVEKLNSQNV